VTDKKHVIESYVPLSQSKLWQFQRDYFDQEGVNAWSGYVPFYVTSNPYIAKCYARIVMGLARDWVAKHPESINSPFYIMELGTGPGRFSYYVLKQLAELQQKLGLSQIQFRYIMTDFTLNNLTFWQNQPQLKPFIEKGMLDFALYNLEEGQPIKLVNSGEVLQEGSIQNPLSIFGNYIFDTVSSDCFYSKSGDLQQSLVSLTVPEDQFIDGKVKNLEALEVSHQNDEISAQYYKDPLFNKVLKGYKNKFKDSYFLIPIGGLKALRYLMKLANSKTLLVSSDKGYSDLSELEHRAFPGITFHGSFSLMVNFHAIGQYYKLCKGNVVSQSPRKGIRSIVAMSGFSLKDLNDTRVAVQDFVEDISAADYFNLHRRISNTYEQCDAATLASHLQFAGWDPHIFKKLITRINAILEETPMQTVGYLANNMKRIADNFYYMPEVHDTFYDIGSFYQSINKPADAIRYYQESEKYFGDRVDLAYNIGSCHYISGAPQQALRYFRRALEIEPENKQIQERIAYLEEQLGTAMAA